MEKPVKKQKVKEPTTNDLLKELIVAVKENTASYQSKSDSVLELMRRQMRVIEISSTGFVTNLQTKACDVTIKHIKSLSIFDRIFKNF